MDPRQINFVIPESMACGLIEKAEGLARSVTTRFANLLDSRDRLRKKLETIDFIHHINDLSKSPAVDVYAVDGACATEEDSSSVLFSTIAVKIAPRQEDISSRHCVSSIPHISNAGQIAQGVMFMQEVMLANETAAQHPTSLTLIDGSRVASLIHLNQFFNALKDEDTAELADLWGRKDNQDQVAQLLREFKSGQHLMDYLVARTNIVGVSKFVSTRDILRKIGEDEMLSVIDDRALATALLKEGEYTSPIFLEKERVIHLSEDYPYTPQVMQASQAWVDKGCPFAPAYVYFKPTATHQAVKLEVVRYFIDNNRLPMLLHQLRREIWTKDIEEAYPLWLADRICKDCTSMSIAATQEIIQNYCRQSDEMRDLLRSHRT